MPIRDAVETDLPFRPEITEEQRAMLIEFAVKRKFGGKIRARGTDPDYPGSTFWELETMMRVVAWPEKKRLWVEHRRNLDADDARIVRSLTEVLATHPPTRH